MAQNYNYHLDSHHQKIDEHHHLFVDGTLKAAKLENTRKFSQTISSEGAEFDIEENEEDFDPHFQRVYISGDDNTGVRLFF